MHDLSNCKIPIWTYCSVDNNVVGQSFSYSELVTQPVHGSDLVIMPGHYLPSKLGAGLRGASWRRLWFES